MAENGMSPSKCIISDQYSAHSTAERIQPLQARCAGRPPSEPLKLYSLCLDCDLLHRHGDRALFAQIASRLADCHAETVNRKSSVKADCAAVQQMLELISIGDPDARLVLPGDSDEFRPLVPLLNQVADFMKDLIEESHETAIGLCEHYETLLLLAGGDLGVRASINSPVELIAKLGELINSQSNTFLDVIKRQRTQEHELQSLNQQLQSIIDFLPDATFVIDAEQRVIAWNKALEEMTGYAKETVLNKGDYAYSIPFYGSRRPALINFIDNEEGLSKLNYKYFKRQGNSIVAESFIPAGRKFGDRHLWIAASSLYDLDGQKIGAIESIRDISDYKRIEHEKELLREQLYHAQKLDSIGQLAGGIAHEFNNILAAILGYASLIETRLDSGSAHLPAVRRIISSAEKAASLTRGMLAFSRKQNMSVKTVDLNLLIADMMEMLCRLAGEDISVEFNPSSQDLLLQADHGQLQQVVLNLYNNARDAMPNGGLLTISTGAETLAGQDPEAPPGIPYGSYVKLTVSDTGSGIEPKLFERIFDPFFTTKEVGKGTGLGLSIVFGIVQQHNGHVKVTSRPGEGTAFSIWFPKVNSSRGKAAEPAICPWRQNRGSETILVGEDNDDVREMIVELLRDVGYHIFDARDGDEAVTIVKQSGGMIDLLLLDVIMPRMNGQEALAAIHQIYPQIPCIFLSGYSDDLLQQKGKLPGEFVQLSKPILPEMLVAAVRSALNGR
ncbi:MAG: ATP-binding protein [Pseudomonadota bacterium]